MTETDLDILASRLAEKLSIQPRWLKLKQAAMYSSIGRSELVRLASEGSIEGFQDKTIKTKPWIFDKESIDGYRRKQYGQSINEEDEQIGLDIVNSIGL
ncbi:hypothetical protein [Desulfobacula sp.]|uniref:hypothetical protein n=1 Tax=Desulfobacula sp. TaxID=2593537 RepID=UPI002639C3C5|nr:hypothetical protein [Desulfobacula sp.]